MKDKNNLMIITSHSYEVAVMNWMIKVILQHSSLERMNRT